MRTLYPAIEPYHSSFLKVDEVHTLYIEQSGNPRGIPVLFLHGGPGGGCTPIHRRFFHPHHYRIILFDQRGCGRSTPHAELKNNTTQHLLNDIETIRNHLEITKWLIFGGSWGSTLGLAYAQRYPVYVLALILRGIFLCRDQDIQWFYQQGTSRLFPDHWQDFIHPIPDSERGDMVSAYYRVLTGESESKQLAAAIAWSSWEGRTATLLGDKKTEQYFSRPEVALSMAKIECHYFINKAFLEFNELLENACRLREIPGVIIHGRYDVICPIDQALCLNESWPTAELRVVPDAGHAATEPGIVDALVSASDEFAERSGEK